MPLRVCSAVFIAASLAPLALSQSLIACENGTAAGFACNEVNLASNLPLDIFNASRGADIWGWTDPDTGVEYAIPAFREGVAFVDISDPDSPVYVGFLPTATTAETWRDVKTYQNYAFVVADGAGSHGMQIFDLTRLRNVANPPETFTPDALYNGVSGNRPNSTHNVVINEESGFAYLVGSDACSGSLHMVDIRDPLNPTPAGCYGDDGVTHDAQCVTYSGPDTDYLGREICVLAQGTFDSSSHITVVDVTDKANPAFVAVGTYTNAVYAHQGWFTEGQRYFLLNDEIDDGASATTRTMVFDMSDLDSPEIAFYYYGPIETTDHNLYVRGQYAFLSNYEGGLRILDISGIDSASLTEVAFFDTYPSGNGESYDGQWSNYPFFPSGTIVANDRDFGLFVLSPSFTIVSNEATELPGNEAFNLGPPTPNPFSDRTSLSLVVGKQQDVVAELLDVTGRRVAQIFSGVVTPGASVPIQVSARGLPSGLYLVRIRGEHFTATRRVSLVQ